MTARRVRPIKTNNYETLRAWCREYQRFSGIMPQGLGNRFLVGMYQRHQALLWPVGNPARAQSFCSGAMHFIMCAEVLDIDLDLPGDIRDIPKESLAPERYANLIDASAQQIIYAVHSRGSNRKSRYDPQKIRRYLTELVAGFLGEVRPPDRAGHIHDEMCIVCRDITTPVC